jgi:hypothetical protein
VTVLELEQDTHVLCNGFRCFSDAVVLGEPPPPSVQTLVLARDARVETNGHKLWVTAAKERR